MSLATQINTINCGASGVLGTGLAGCRIDQARVTALGLLTKGFKFTEEITKDYLRSLQLSGDLIMLQGVVSYTDATADDNVVTREGSGIKVVAGKNPYEKVVTFDNGINFATALTYLDGFGKYDLIEFDVNNTIWMTTTKNMEPKGFTLGMFNSGKYIGSNGTEASSKTIALQKIKRDEWDKRVAWIADSEWDADYEELTGVNEVEITVDPVVAGNSIVVSVFLLDKTHPVEGLLPSDFLVKNGGIENNPTIANYNTTTKKYTLTVPDVISGDTLDISLKGIVLTTLDVLYKSNIITAMVM